ncbi:hypothetical protein IIC65_05535 [Candidatus Sumerlaeota bacterium]|nr:hypothetical protein [Candidatus Sumerlaeota bacterium]
MRTRIAARLTVLLGVVPAMFACSYAPVADNAIFNEEVFLASMPRSLAIAPVTNLTKVQEAGEEFRRKLYGALAPLAYEDVELDNVDSILSSKASVLNITPSELSPSHIADPDLADAVLFVQLEKVSRLFLFVFAQIRVDLRVALYDTKSNTLLYQNHYIVRNLQINSTFSTIFLMRNQPLEDALNLTAREVAEGLPAPPAPSSSGSLAISEVEVEFPRPTLLEGDRVVLRVSATPGLSSESATFSIGQVAADQPLIESTPGQYAGVYEVQAGDNGRFLFVTVSVIDPDNPDESITHGADDQPFAIDTIPPVPYEIISWSQRPGDRTIRLRFAPESIISPEAESVPVLFHVFRGLAGGGSLAFIGSSEIAEFEDKDAEPGVEYEYAVVAEDAAGNQSDGVTRVLITPRSSGG